MFIDAISGYAKAAILAVILVVLAGTHWKAYTLGRDRVQAAWDKDKAERAEQALAATRAARATEQRLVAERQKVEMSYVDAKRKAAVAAASARSELDRLRDALAAAAGGRVPEGAAATGGADGAASTGELFGDCAARYAGLAEAATAVRDKLIGLQDYVQNVCAKP